MGRSLIKVILDCVLWVIAAPLAFWLRLEDSCFNYCNTIIVYTLIGMSLKITGIFVFGLYRHGWRKSGMADFYLLAKSVGCTSFILSGCAFFLNPHYPIPRSIPIIEGFLAFVFLGGIRYFARMFYEHRALRRVEQTGDAKRVVLVGAGESGTMIAREMLRHPEMGLIPVGYLDDDPLKRRKSFVGLPVLGVIDDLHYVVNKTKADEVIIAIPSASGSVIRRVVELARSARIKCRIIPGLYEVLSGKVMVSQIRNVDVEDLLRREPVKLNLEEIADYIRDRVVLITGAGGSIGSELVRQVIKFHPAELVLLGRGENSLFNIDQELKRKRPEVDYQLVVGDIRDREKMKVLFKDFKPDLVFHAAAHKHVPMMEQNPDEAVLNNIGGTKNLVDLSLSYDVERFVNISTDKAVNPTSVMGAAKRVAEQVVLWGSRRASDGQVFVSVRFGNVLGSRGSVVPLFRDQIKRGGPVTVTHPDMKRYFMTIPEAVQLVMQAGGLGENGAVYVLDMGEPVRIIDLAVDLIRLSGLEPGEDIEIVFTGARPGEKLEEELLTAEEGVTASKYEKIFVARQSSCLPDEEFELMLQRLFSAARKRDEMEIKRLLKILVPTFEYNETLLLKQFGSVL